MPSILKNVAASQTDTSIVAAVTGKRYRVEAVAMTDDSAAATTVTFNSKGSDAGTAISATFDLAASGNVVLNQNTEGWFETNTSEALTVTTGGGAVGLQIVYRVVNG